MMASGSGGVERVLGSMAERCLPEVVSTGILARILAGCLAGLIAILGSWSAAAADPVQEALKIPGKTSLYQRVLTRPGAALRPTPEGSVKVAAELAPLSLFYVYERRQADGREWLALGSGAKGTPDGWLPAAQAIDWRQTLTVAFTRTADRAPTLFFRDRNSLVDLLQSADESQRVKGFRDNIHAGRIPEGFPVIAEEPETFVDPNRHFYLLPIMGHDQVYLDSGLDASVLEVAAVTLQAGEQDLLGGVAKGGAASQGGGDSKDYKVGVVFVVDTTASMQPYVDRTRTAVHRMYDRLRSAGLGGAVSFGMVAFRDSTTAVPALQYVSRVVATLQDGQDPHEFFLKADRAEATNVSSQGFDEDPYAGIYDAIEKIDWKGYSGRFVVLITDAGAREANDPLSTTHLGADRLRILAQEKDQASGGSKIAIAVLHLLTPAGAEDHRHAAAQYRALARWGDSGDLYFPVEGGTVQAFGKQVDAMADALIAQIQGIRSGQAVEVPRGASDLQRKTAMVGRAMQLAYLGRERGSQAPRLIDAWVSDRDLDDPTRKTLEVRVLIDKNQLSNLQETLQAILAAGERTTLSAKDFFAQLRGAAAALARDPDKVSTVDVKRLADVGLVGEWLDDLPYTSQVMNLTEQRWLSRSYAEQQEVLDAIEEKIRLYRQIYDDTDRWIDLSGRSSKGDAVTTIPLDALP
jgi:serine/threonine-protein kinase PpkA